LAYSGRTRDFWRETGVDKAEIGETCSNQKNGDSLTHAEHDATATKLEGNGKESSGKDDGEKEENDKWEEKSQKIINAPFVSIFIFPCRPIMFHPSKREALAQETLNWWEEEEEED
jgi:hypothetical protein